MSEKIQKFRVSRFRQLIFPKEVIIDHAHVMTRKRKFPAFWVIKEESIPLRSVAAIQITHGLFFSTVLVENSGGPWPIEVAGLPKRQAVRIRATIEAFKPVYRSSGKKNSDIDSDIEIPDSEETKGSKTVGAIKNAIEKVSKRQKVDDQVIEPIESSWDGSEFDPTIIEPIESTSKPKKNLKDLKEKQKIANKPLKMNEPLPSIDEVLYAEGDSESNYKNWINELVEPPKRKYSTLDKK